MRKKPTGVYIELGILDYFDSVTVARQSKIRRDATWLMPCILLAGQGKVHAWSVQGGSSTFALRATCQLTNRLHATRPEPPRLGPTQSRPDQLPAIPNGSLQHNMCTSKLCTPNASAGCWLFKATIMFRSDTSAKPIKRQRGGKLIFE